jgi:hypothetical protein
MGAVSLRPQPLLAHWAAGAVVTMIAQYYFIDANGQRLFRSLSDGYRPPAGCA